MTQLYAQAVRASPLKFSKTTLLAKYEAKRAFTFVVGEGTVFCVTFRYPYKSWKINLALERLPKSLGIYVCSDTHLIVIFHS